MDHVKDVKNARRFSRTLFSCRRALKKYHFFHELFKNDVTAFLHKNTFLTSAKYKKLVLPQFRSSFDYSRVRFTEKFRKIPFKFTEFRWKPDYAEPSSSPCSNIWKL